MIESYRTLREERMSMMIILLLLLHVLYCTALYCTVLYSTVLHCTVPSGRRGVGRWP